MFDEFKLEQFSVLEELSSATPVWRPFMHHTERVADVSKQERDMRDEHAH